MKKSIQLLTFIPRILSLLVLMVLLCTFADSNATILPMGKNKTVVLFSKNDDGNINILIKTPVEKKVEFYLFKASGELVKKINTRSKINNTINKLSDGQYLYQCFEKDLQLISGTLTVNAENMIYN
jgi:hypothetical protein